jgi:hypothetical protein
MSVNVTMLPATIPPRLSGEDISRIRRFEDPAGDNAATFQYSVHARGALVIWCVTDVAANVHTVIGPAAWEDVEGDLCRSL